MNVSTTGRKVTAVDPEKPSPCVQAGGINGGNTSQYFVEATTNERPRMSDHESNPPYSVPLMTEINVIPWNGLKVASTFSGAGGSCTGYRMAGFKVVWANEFVPVAQASYKANAAADCYLDCRDIKHVQPQDILDRCGLKQGELDLFDGSPPCQAFSTAGKREKGWGQKKTYEHGASQCNETLFGEYIRLLRGLMPKVFVAENVSGLVKGTAKGYFLEILRKLKDSGYQVVCKVLDAQWLGVPQQRQRTIFVGVRNDLNLDPVHPKPLAYRYSVRDALPWIVEIRQTGVFNEPDRVTTPSVTTPSVTTPSVTTQGMGAKRADSIVVEVDIEIQSGAFPKKYSSSSPSPAVMAGRTTEMRSGTERRKFTIAELKRICAFPDDFILCGSYAQQWERLGNSVPPVMMFHIASEIRDRVLLSQSRV